MATRRIKQSTFDDAVKENMEEFGLEREEAEVDAVKQFEASGIDLSNIVTRGGDTHPVLAAVRVLSTATSPLPESASELPSSLAIPEVAAVAEALTGLEMELQRDAAATRAVAGSNDAIKYLTLLVAASCGHKPVALRDAAPLLQQALRVLRLLCSEHPDNRALVAVGFARVLVELGSAHIPGLDAGEEAAGVRSPAATLAVQCSALQLAGLLCVKREGWKVAAYRLAAPRAVARHVDAAVAAARAAPAPAPAAGSEAGAGASGDAPGASPAGFYEHAQRVAAGCALLSRMLTDDDLSVEASKVYDHARTIAGSAPAGGAPAAESGVDELAGLGLVGKLLDLLQAYRHDVAVCAEALAAVRCLTVNEDVCREIDRRGGVALISQALSGLLAEPYVPSPAAPAVAAAAAASHAAAAPVRRKGLQSVPEGAEGADADADAAAADAEEGESESSAPTTTAAPSSIEAPTAATGPGAVTAALAPASVAPDAAARAASARCARMVRNGLAVLRTVAGSDAVKKRMCESAAHATGTHAGPGTAGSAAAGAPSVSPLHLALAAMDKFSAPGCAGDALAAGVTEQAAAAVGNLCLRLGEHADMVVACGGLAAVAKGMRTHAASLGVQRACCLAIRNVVVRSKARAAAAVEEGLEGLLTEAYKRHPHARDVVYAAMRDMGLHYDTDIGKEQAARAERAIAAGDISVK